MIDTAERRMFAKSIVMSDAFLDMPLSARCLYYTFGMLADDDGFIGNPKAILRQCGASEKDMRILIEKRYVLQFQSGVLVIKHWRMNNYLQNDRKKTTTYIEELSSLKIDEKGAYTEKEDVYTKCIQNVYTDKDSIGKDSIGKDSIEKHIPSDDGPLPFEPTSEELTELMEIEPREKKPGKRRYGEYRNILLSDKEVDKLKVEYGSNLTDEAITFLDEYIERKGYKCKSHYLTLKKWVFKAVQEEKNKHHQEDEGHTNKNFKGVDAWLAATANLES